MPESSFKSVLVTPLHLLLRATAQLREAMRRLYAHALLAQQLSCGLPTSVVVLGRAWVFGTGVICFGKDALLYPDLHLETQGSGKIELGEGVVISRGVHIVSMAGITIGDGTMIGEYASLRDANHMRMEGVPMRHAGYTAEPIVVGSEVWIGRGVIILGGVTIGDGATIGANAVVTRDVAANTTVAGVPAKQIFTRIERTSTPLPHVSA